MIVIADDITGAAEIAGIAFAKGQQVRLVCALDSDTRKSSPTRESRITRESSTTRATSPPPLTSPTTVIATDTRSLTADEAAIQMRHLAAGLSGQCLFKKTDSALRGHVVAELQALLQNTAYRRAVYLPANPSKGRIIRQGIYYINETPLHQTEFSFDPEFPAHTSSLRERFPEAEAAGILMPDAESLDDIRQVLAHYDDGETLFAGAADLFNMMEPTTQPRVTDQQVFSKEQSMIILCGSTQSQPLDIGIPVSSMPREIYDGDDDIAKWDTSCYNQGQQIILSIPYSHRTGKEVAIHLRTMMARITKRLVNQHRPQQLIIEGGATAWATMQTLGWTQFDITRQVAPGVVQMRAANGTLVTLKPGSYPWGGLFS